MNVVNSWNEWDPLEEVIVGSAQGAAEMGFEPAFGPYYPPGEPAGECRGMPVPQALD